MIVYSGEEKERMMQAENRIIADMKELMKRSPEDHLTWKSTKQDLFQMIYILYESGEVRDEYGIMVTFAEMVQRFCGILHVKVPRNPRQFVKQSATCNGLRRAPLLLRYHAMYI